MRGCLLVAALLASACNQWIRSSPPAAELRDRDSQVAMRVLVESSCEGPIDTVSRTGSGVIVSNWQVLTALHVVDCQSSIATIHVTTSRGRWSFGFERAWERWDVARIQIGSADNLGPGIRPPTVRRERLERYDSLYIQAASPRPDEIVGWVDGAYGGSSYGGFVTYKAQTEDGVSGAGIYDAPGNLVGIHHGKTENDEPFGALVTPEMVPR